MFNNDIQGTAGVALAGLLGTVRAQDLPLTDSVNQKIVVVGAGSAGLGVFNMATQGCFKNGRSWSKSSGLITTERKGVDPEAAPFAKAPWKIEGLGLREGANLVKVVKKVKPHILLGLSGVGGVFNEQVLKAMRESDSPKPAIFAMSNLMVNAECTAIDAFNRGGENIGLVCINKLIGLTLLSHYVANATNNSIVSIYPSSSMCCPITLTFANHILVVREWKRLEWEALLSGALLILDGMLQAVSECLASFITDEEIQSAVAEELAEGRCDVGPRELRQMSKEVTVEYVKPNMWYPVYSPLLFMINEVPIISVCVCARAGARYFFADYPNVLQPFKYS
ncbi:hypothetical protein CsSME_00012062 [Camellia sinensis var. sinensis]